MPQIPLGVGSYESPNLPLSAQRCINAYQVFAQDRSLNGEALFFSAGVASFASLGPHGSRGSIVMGDVYYNVNGTYLYSVDSSGNETSIGEITGSTRVSMAHNGEKLCIVVPGGNAYVYDSTIPSLSRITDPDYTTSDTVCFKDGYYIFTQTDGKQWFISALNDPTSIDALDYDSAELSPDKIIACHASHDEVYILGEWTVEPFRNIGGADFPFRRVQGASLEKGCHAKHTPIQWEGHFYFVGGGKNEQSGIYRTTGTNEPQRLSTDTIESSIQRFSSDEISDAFSYTYSVKGHAFVGFTFQSTSIPSKTFEYNVIASQLSGRPIWHERQTGVTDNYFDVASVDFVYNKLVVSRISDGKIGYLDEETYTEFSEAIRRVKINPNIIPGKDNFTVNKIELTLDPGTGLVRGQGSDPKIMMDYSDDGGKTWSEEMWADSGKMGDYLRRCQWRRLGRVPHYRCFRFSMTDPVPGVWIRLDVN